MFITVHSFLGLIKDKQVITEQVYKYVGYLMLIFTNKIYYIYIYNVLLCL